MLNRPQTVLFSYLCYFLLITADGLCCILFQEFAIWAGVSFKLILEHVQFSLYNAHKVLF